MGIYEKLLTLQAKLKVPKGQYSDFGGYYYRSCEDITEAAKPLLVEVKAVLLLTDEIVVIGNRTYVKAVAKLIDTESDGVVEVDGYAREDESQKGKDVAQITGSCSSYARKYALNGLFALDDAKDADALPPVQQPAEKPAGSQKPAEKVTSYQMGQLQALAKQKGVAVDSVVAGYKINNLQDMDTKQWAQAMNSLRKRADAQ